MNSPNTAPPDAAAGMARARPRAAALVLLLIAAAAAAAMLAPLPSPLQVRDWAHGAGPWLPVAFFLAYVVFTIAPIPRTMFTLSAGLLFGAALGIALAVTATIIAAVAAFVLVRMLGRDAVAARLHHRAVARVNDRLARRGWLAVGSLRLIAAAPFSIVNYCCAISSVRLLPYTLATAVAIIPGTVAMVVLTDALTGTADPRMLFVSAAGITLGVAGLIIDARTRRSAAHAPAEQEVIARNRAEQEAKVPAQRG